MAQAEIELNGNKRLLSEGQTVAELITSIGLGGKTVAVELNGAVVKRTEHAHTELQAGDRVEVVHFVGGG